MAPTAPPAPPASPAPVGYVRAEGHTNSGKMAQEQHGAAFVTLFLLYVNEFWIPLNVRM